MPPAASSWGTCRVSVTKTDRNAAAARARDDPGTVRQIENANPITKAQVQELVDGMDAARVRRDVAAMLAYVAPDAVFEVEYPLPQGMQFKRFSKNEYPAYLRGGRATSEASRRRAGPQARRCESSSPAGRRAAGEGDNRNPRPGLRRFYRVFLRKMMRTSRSKTPPAIAISKIDIL